MPKEILLITNYFPPEKGAASNRMFSLAQALHQHGYQVKVVCPLPNYPAGKIFEGFHGKLNYREDLAYAQISRLWIWPSNSTNKFVRLLSMLSFCLSLMAFFIFTKTPKTIFVQYSPVFVGFTAVIFGKILSKKIILNVSDLWPLAGLEMGILREGFYYSILLKMEAYCYRNSHLIVGQSKEILSHINSLAKNKPTFLYRNLPNFLPPDLGDKSKKEPIKIVYAGLLGVAQGLEYICKNLNIPQGINLHIYGAGPEAEKIKFLNKERIYFHGELDRASLHKALQNYDIAFIPLIKRIYGSVPSKIFEYTRLGLPVLYFAGGEGETIVQREGLGWVVPENNLKALQEFIDSFSYIELEKYPPHIVQQKSIKAFDFKKQFETFVEVVDSV